MFEKLFKTNKKSTSQLEVMVIDEPAVGKHVYPKEVYEIHHEFEVASDKLLASANEVIKEAASKDVNKVKRLLNLGFKQVQQVEEIQPLIKKVELSKEQIDLVAYYKREYPLNKFITEEQVETICKKYNLVCGGVDRFKGFVPEKNLKQIEKFKLKSNHRPMEYAFGDVWFSFEDLCKPNSFDSRGWYGHKTHYYEKSVKLGIPQNDYVRYKEGINLSICAPVKDMDMSGMTIKNGYKMETIHIPDPVVLQAVKGGYLILTAWGDEASDPLVTNEIFN